MSIFGYIAKGFSIAKSSSRLILTVFAISFAWVLVNLPFVSPDGAAEPGAVTVVLGILFMLVTVFVQAGTIGYIEQVAKHGSSSLSVFKQAGLKNYFRILGLGVVMGLVMLILAVIAIIGFLAGGPEAEPSSAAVVLAVIVALTGLVLLLFMFMAPYAAVVDGKGVFGALKMSFGIVKRNFWTVLAVGLLMVLVGFAADVVLRLIGGALAAAMPGKVSQAIAGFLSSGVNAYLGIVTASAFMSVYLTKTSGVPAGAVSASN